MKAGRGLIDELCFAAEGLSGTAASATLRTLGSIMERAPSGRLFDAISTLCDTSAKAAQALEQGSRAMGQNDDDAATRIGEALIHMDTLAEAACGGQPASGKRRRGRRA